MYDSIDLKPAEISAYEKLSTEIVTAINERLSGRVKNYANIFLTGGGAAALYKYVKKEYPNLREQSGGAYANARGYLALFNT
jgi:hypothetical protein